jgi:hypothetical protein
MTADGPGLMMAYAWAATGLMGLFAAFAIPIYVDLLLPIDSITVEGFSVVEDVGRGRLENTPELGA